MRHVMTFFQNHLHVTRSEAAFVGVLTTLIVLGTIGTRLVPLVADDELHDHTTVDALISTLDSLGRQEPRSAVTVPGDSGSAAPIAPGSTSDSPETASGKAGKPLPTGRINVNRASARDLERIPGIGPAMAERIIERRRARPFTSPEDLLDVMGIGQKKLEKMRPFISVP